MDAASYYVQGNVFDAFDFFSSGTAGEDQWSLFPFGENGTVDFEFDLSPARMPALPAAGSGSSQTVAVGFAIGADALMVDLDPILNFK